MILSIRLIPMYTTAVNLGWLNTYIGQVFPIVHYGVWRVYDAGNFFPHYRVEVEDLRLNRWLWHLGALCLDCDLMGGVVVGGCVSFRVWGYVEGERGGVEGVVVEWEYVIILAQRCGHYPLASLCLQDGSSMNGDR